MANQFLLQVDAIGNDFQQFVLAVGQVTAPPVLGNDQAREAAIREVVETGLAITPYARFGLTIGRLDELIQLLVKARKSLADANDQSMKAAEA